MKDILSQIDRKDGMTVPEGYFDDFAARMAASLPPQEWETPGRVMPRSFWQKVRPYLYLAAMFMGVWCMMKMFDLMSPSGNSLSIDGNPTLVAALDNDHFVSDYVINEGDVDDYQLFDDLYNEGFSPSDYEDLTH